jgi:hypothetical protein
MSEPRFYPQVQILHKCIVYSLWVEPINNQIPIHGNHQTLDFFSNCQILQMFIAKFNHLCLCARDINPLIMSKVLYDLNILCFALIYRLMLFFLPTYEIITHCNVTSTIRSMT